LISFRDLIAGILIGALSEPWWVILIACIVWGVVSWFLIWVRAGKREYKAGTRVFFRSPVMSRFIEWWGTAFVVSLVVATVTFLVRHFLPSL
jgi:hypothetical protein